MTTVGARALAIASERQAHDRRARYHRHRDRVVIGAAAASSSRARTGQHIFHTCVRVYAQESVHIYIYCVDGSSARAPFVQPHKKAAATFGRLRAVFVVYVFNMPCAHRPYGIPGRARVTL